MTSSNVVKITKRRTVTMAAATAAYCFLRERLDEMKRELQAMPYCEHESGEPHSGTGEWCAKRRYYPGPLSPEQSPWWELPPEQLRAYGWCESCIARIPLWLKRYEAKKQLGSRMRAMRTAYRREIDRSPAGGPRPVSLPSQN